MNDPFTHSPVADVPIVALTDELLDLLADDALDPTRRAAVLRSLDADPSHWRRCALALLEAQAWRGAMGDANVRVVAPAPAAPPAERVTLRRWRPWLAAAVVAAFAAGTLFGGAGRRAGRTDQASQRTVAPTPVQQTDPAAQTPRPSPIEPAMPAAAPRPAALPEYVRRQLERDGYEVQGSVAKLIPVALADGRTVAVPVEALKYQYVGRRVQ